MRKWELPSVANDTFPIEAILIYLFQGIGSIFVLITHLKLFIPVSTIHLSNVGSAALAQH